MEHYRYDIIGASVNHGIKVHPQEDMKRLGYEVIKSEPVSIADCWWFRVKNHIEPVPPYLIKMSDDFEFSDERNRE